MTSLKTWCLLPLTVLLLLSIAPTETEVVKMSKCNEFFLQKTPPHVPGSLEKGEIKNPNRNKAICQTYRDDKRFVTLYDTKNRIPVFSAYKYRGEGPLKEDQKRPEDVLWMIEPQVESLKNDKNMEECCIREEYKHQASDKDYNDKRYDKGHLFPSSYGFKQNDKISTFTLTNAVPQFASFNQGSWRRMESCVKCVLNMYCTNDNDGIEGYVVTGALASPDTKVKLNKVVNIPSVLWSAFCCYSKKEKKVLASAYWGDNTEGHSEHLQTKTLAELKQTLDIEVFPKTNCPLKETVAEFYQKVDKECECQPQASTTSAPAPLPTKQQKLLEILYDSPKLDTICTKLLQKRAKYKGPHSQELWNLCLKRKRNVLKPENIGLPLKEFLRKIINIRELFED